MTARERMHAFLHGLDEVARTPGRHVGRMHEVESSGDRWPWTGWLDDLGAGLLERFPGRWHALVRVGRRAIDVLALDDGLHVSVDPSAIGEWPGAPEARRVVDHDRALDWLCGGP